MTKLSDEDRDLIILASTVRGGLKCRLTNRRLCGYSIRPELTVRLTEATMRTLELIDVPRKKTFSNSENITKILNAIEGLEDLSPTPYGIDIVKKLNGFVAQPTTHDEVMTTFQQIDRILGVNA